MFCMKCLQCLGLTCFTYTEINNDTLIMVLCSSGQSCDLSSAKIMDTTLNIQEMKDQTQIESLSIFSFFGVQYKHEIMQEKTLYVLTPHIYTNRLLQEFNIVIIYLAHGEITFLTLYYN